MSASKVAFVIPVYNGERYLAATLDSVLSQEGVQVEVVAVNDGSTDGSASLLASYADRVKVVDQPNRGVCLARNNGFAHTSAPYVTFLDQDDWVEPTFAQKMSQALDAKPEAAGVFCEATIHEDAGEAFGLNDGDYSKDMYLSLLAGACPMSPGAVMLRRKAFISVGGFDPSLQNIGEDLDLWIKLARYYPWTYLPDHLYSWRGHGLNMSERFVDMYKGNKHLLSRYTTLSPLGEQDASLAGPALRKKQQRCAWDIRRTLKKKLRLRRLKAGELWKTIQQVCGSPELLPHLLRLRVIRRR